MPDSNSVVPEDISGLEQLVRERTSALSAANLALKKQEEQLLRKNQWLSLISEAAADLLRATDPDRMVRDLFEKVKERLGLDVFFHFMLDPSRKRLLLDAFGGVEESVAKQVATLELGQIVCGTVAQCGQRIVVRDIQGDGACLRDGEDKASGVRAMGVRAYACHPLMVGDRLIGTLSFGSRRRDEFQDDELAFMQTICHYVAMARERLRSAADANRLAAMVRSSQDAIVSVGLDGTIQSWNAGAERIFGYSAAEAIGNSISIISPPKTDVPPLALVERVGRGESVSGLETVRARKDGSLVAVSVNADPVLDASGRVVSVAGMVRDINERQLAEQLLAAQNRALELVATEAPLSEALAALTAAVEEQSAGQALASILLIDENFCLKTGAAPSLPDKYNEAIDGIKAASGVGTCADAAARNQEVCTPDIAAAASWKGLSHLPLGLGLKAAWSVPIRSSDGRVLGTFGTYFRECRLPTERERQIVGAMCRVAALAIERQRAQAVLREAKEEAERASEAKSEFLATLSHELRTPLTPVLLTVSLMETNRALPADLREDVATIRRNVELESRLISDLLDLTRISKGKLHLDMQDADLHLLVRLAVDICQREASARIKLELGARHHMVRGDSTRLQQIFWNLINNAIKFTGADGTITIRSSDGPDGRVRVEVIDSGAGIDASVLPKLFNAFEQGEARAERQAAGLGLGLTISRKLAEMHGGTIDAVSGGRGMGATFTVELPADLRAEPAPLKPRQDPQLEASESLNILLVEDHEPTLSVLTRLLRGMGHRVTPAATAASAIASAANDGFDLIISDLGLPDASGLDVMRRVRDRYAGRAIALTGYGMESDISACREAGFADHLTKPVDLAALKASIEKVWAGSRTTGTSRTLP